ncbi:MAG: alpha/beta hydrolase [Sporomusaceae bacterium]|nr:alpha/beta hydrolase [Sporomusaceae bacterium]
MSLSYSKKTIQWHCLLFLLFFGLLTVLYPTISQAAELETDLVKIPLKLPDANYNLDGKIYKPEGDGPFPLIVLTHGTPRTATDRLLTNVNTYFRHQAAYFVKQGYVVLFVVRRGFGESSAPYAEATTLTAGRRNYTHAGLEAAKDLSAAISFGKTLPYVNPSKIILVGQSTGGHSVIATGSLQIPGVIGIVNFAGGRGSYAPDQVYNKEDLIASMGFFGKTSRIPTLWLYATNDHYFNPDLAQAMVKAYQSAGGNAAFVTLPDFSDDGHRSFVGNQKAWSPAITAFLATLLQQK